MFKRGASVFGAGVASGQLQQAAWAIGLLCGASWTLSSCASEVTSQPSVAPKSAPATPASPKSEPVASAVEPAPDPVPAAPVAVPRACAAAEPAVPVDNAVAAPAGKSKSAPACFPERGYVERLCAQNYPDVALVMFHPQSPWKRGYLKGETKAWTAAPGAQQQDRLKFKEEILVLQNNNAEGGALVGQGDSFYALRWNGSCVKLTEEEIVTLAPWAKVAAPIQWSWLDEVSQTALLADAKVAAAVGRWRKECRSASSEQPKCTSAAEQLTEAVATSVRAGLVLPEPAHRP